MRVMQRKPTVDGFIPRRSSGTVGDASLGGLVHGDDRGLKRHTPDQPRTVLKPQLPGGALQPTSTGSVQRQPIYRSDIDDSLRDIDSQPAHIDQHPKRRKPRSKRRIIKWVVLVLVLGLVAAAGWLGYKTLSTGQSVFNGDVFGLVQQKKLQQDSNGRTNILLFGTSEDDPGHDAPNLTDSIMVLTVNQTTNDAYMVSIPRDLKVSYDGRTCGSAGKINVYYGCIAAGDTKEVEQERQTAMRKLVGGIVGLDIQYSVHVNYSVVRDIVGALGTITVNIEGSGGAPGVMDSNFDWKCRGGNAYASLATMKKNCPPDGHFIDYLNGPAVLDAEHALYLAQARGDTVPTYGLGRSNFDRELNQQKIIKAIREKAMSTGTLTNIVTVTKLLDAMGGNLRTNFDTSEVRTLVDLAKNTPNDAIQSISLVDASPVLFGGDGANNVIPLAGTYDYSAIQAYIQKKINATPVSKEGAHVIVLNASGVTGAARVEAAKLESLGMIVDSVDNVSVDASIKTNRFYQVGTITKTFTQKKLTERYGGSALTATPPVTPAVTTNFVIVIVAPIETTASATP